MGIRGLTCRHDRGGIGVHHLVPLFERHLGRKRVDVHPRVIHQPLDAPAFFRQLVQGFAERGRVGDVGFHRNPALRDFGRRPWTDRQRTRAREAGDVVALLRQCQGDGGADPPAGASDDDAFTFTHHKTSPSSFQQTPASPLRRRGCGKPAWTGPLRREALRAARRPSIAGPLHGRTARHAGRGR
ncbi:hypothetical protein D3C86_1375670 [compost metagenome]